MKKRAISILILLLVLICAQQVLFTAFASSGISLEDEISDEFLSELANDNEQHFIWNMYSGEELLYDKNTNLNSLRRVYTAGKDAEEFQPITILPENPEYNSIMMMFEEAYSSVNYNYKAETPYSAVCLISFSYGYNGIAVNGYGTGFVIGHAQIATAAHNIKEIKRMKDLGILLSPVSLYLPLKGARGEIIVRKYVLQTAETSTGSCAYPNGSFIPPDVDYGIINVVGSLDVHGIFKLSNQANAGDEVIKLGYDGETADEHMKSDQSFISLPISADPGTITDIYSEYINFEMKLKRGQSGGPIVVVKDDYIEVIAIIAAGNDEKNLTVGKRISSEVYSFYNARVGFNNINKDSFIKNIEIDHPNYYSGEEIRVHVFKVPTQTAWVGLYKSNVIDYPDNATGMWRYLENNSKNTPVSFNNKKDVTIKLKADIHNIKTDTYHAIPNGIYKIVLFKDSGYNDLISVQFNVGGSSILSINYSNSVVSITYQGVCHSDAWVGIYNKNEAYGAGHPSIAWTYVFSGSVLTNSDEIKVNLSPGSYKAVLFADSGYVELYSIEFTVQ